MDKPRVYSYLRFSDPKQAAGGSIDRQMAYAKRWAADHGMELDSTLTMRDEGLSAYHQRHVKSGALGVFLAAIDDGRIPSGSVLIVEGLDRLSRAEPIQAQAQLAQIVNAGITVVTASDGKEYNRARLKDNPMDLVYSLLVMIRAHEESDTKSKRVKASIRRQCEGWLAGTYRGKIRNGKDPIWVRKTPEGFELDQRAAEVVMLTVDLFKRGYGAKRIMDVLVERGMSLSGQRGLYGRQLYRMVNQRAMCGEKELTVDGHHYCLPGYYPALLTPEQLEELSALASNRTRPRNTGIIPGIITGIKLLRCGHCGGAVSGQNNNRNRVRRAGNNAAGRRLLCIKATQLKCDTGGCSVDPIERALLEWCSDQMNMDFMSNGSDTSRAILSSLASEKRKLAEQEQQLERVTEALLAASDGSTPLAFVRKARELEDGMEASRRLIRDLEHELANFTAETPAAPEWAAIKDAAIACDYDARIAVRELIIKTFKSLVITIPDAKMPNSHIVTLMMISKSGARRELKIHRKTGELIGEGMDTLTI